MKRINPRYFVLIAFKFVIIVILGLAKEVFETTIGPIIGVQYKVVSYLYCGVRMLTYHLKASRRFVFRQFIELKGKFYSCQVQTKSKQLQERTNTNGSRLVDTIVVCESRSNAGRKQAVWGKTIRAAGDRGTVTGHGVRVQGCGQRHGQSASSGGRDNGTEAGDGGRGWS